MESYTIAQPKPRVRRPGGGTAQKDAKVVYDAIIIYLHETDAAKQKTEINQVLTTVTITEMQNYLHKSHAAAKKGRTLPGYEKYINLMLPPSGQQAAKVLSYKLHIGDKGMTLSPEDNYSGAEVGTVSKPVRLMRTPKQTSHQADGAGMSSHRAGKDATLILPKDFDPSQWNTPVIRHRPIFTYTPENNINQVQEPSDEAPVTPPSEDRFITLVEKPGAYEYHGEDFPWVRFGGKYLIKYGFAKGDKVTVHLEPQKITLTVDERQEAEPPKG
jgi:hypothetical protein